ncbi:MAG TPA: ATP-binding cassette domain-containing protein [Geminicoccaceae bacterium]|nr:ATP-binding cassette domain-containing protein [Geminicoccaceae bacterium]
MAALTAMAAPTLTVTIREKWFAPIGDAPAKHALGEIAFSVAQGDVLAVIGPSGCGKTTLLSLIAGLDRSFSGRIDLAPDRRLAYVFQEPRLLPWRTVEDNVRLVLDGGAEDEDRVRAVLAQVGLTSASRLFASRLSLGMARRAALARAFVIEPSLLLLDEPFISLDEQTADRLRLLLQDLLRMHRTTAILVTHNLREAAMLARRLILLSASPARLIGDVEVPLSEAERRDERAIDAFRSRLVADYRLGELSKLEAPVESLS